MIEIVKLRKYEADFYQIQLIKLCEDPVF